MKKVVLLFITTILLLSCSDDDEKEKTWNEINIPVPTMSKMVMTEVEETYMTTSTAINTIKNEYVYTDNKLTSYTNTQSISIGDEIVQELSHQVTLQYENNLVTMIDSEDNKWIYTLNEQGYATQCTYTFSPKIRIRSFSERPGPLSSTAIST